MGNLCVFLNLSYFLNSEHLKFDLDSFDDGPFSDFSQSQCRPFGDFNELSYDFNANHNRFNFEETRDISCIKQMCCIKIYVTKVTI